MRQRNLHQCFEKWLLYSLKWTAQRFLCAPPDSVAPLYPYYPWAYYWTRPASNIALELEHGCCARNYQR